MQELKSRLKELGIELVVMIMEKPGCYIPDWKTIFVNENLSEEKMKLVLLHELKHVLDHEDYVTLYKLPIFRAKMENEANVYMLDCTIEEHEGVYNYSQLIEAFDIGLGYDIRYAQ